MKKNFTPEKGKRERERGKWLRVIASKSRYITAVFCCSVCLDSRLEFMAFLNECNTKYLG